MNRKRNTTGWIILLIFMLFSYYCLVYQFKKDIRLFKKRSLKITAMNTSPLPYLGTIMKPARAIPYQNAYAKILESPEKTFWLVTNDFSPALLLNAAVYPKEIRMSVETQTILIERMLKLTDTPILHNPPHIYEQKIVVESE